MYLIHYNHNHDRLGRFSTSSDHITVTRMGNLKKKTAPSKMIYKNAKKINNDYTYGYAKPDKQKTYYRNSVKKNVLETLLKDKELNELNSKYNKYLIKNGEIDDKQYEILNKYEDGEKMSSSDQKKYDILEKQYNKAGYKAAEFYNKTIERRNKIVDPFLKAYSEAMIKDLDLSDNSEIRDYIIRNASDTWYLESNRGIRDTYLYDVTERQKEKRLRLKEGVR